MLKGPNNLTTRIQIATTPYGVNGPAPWRSSYCSRLNNNSTIFISLSSKTTYPKRPFNLSSRLCSTSQPGQSQQVLSKRSDDLFRMGGLSEDGLSYKECFIIRSYEVGINKTVTIETVANFLQEVGCNHPKSLGYSTDGLSTTPSMTDRHLIWVTAHMHIEMYKYPTWGDVVEIETWSQSDGRIGMRREFILKNFASGDVIGRATSKWVMMNQNTRLLEKISPAIYEEYLVYCPKTLRLAFSEEYNRSLKNIPKLNDQIDYSRRGLVPKGSDFDMNQHVNNVTYIGWILESMPQDIIHTHELRSITMNYKRECQHGDIVDSLATAISTRLNSRINELSGMTSSFQAEHDKCREFLHLLRLSDNGYEINRGRTQWIKKSNP